MGTEAHPRIRISRGRAVLTLIDCFWIAVVVMVATAVGSRFRRQITSGLYSVLAVIWGFFVIRWYFPAGKPGSVVRAGWQKESCRVPGRHSRVRSSTHMPEGHRRIRGLVLVATLVLAANAQAQLAVDSHIGVTAQPSVTSLGDRNVADAQPRSQRAFEWTGASIGGGRPDTASRSDPWRPVRLGALVGGGVGLAWGVIADARQSGPTKIYGIASLGGLIAGVFAGAFIGSIVSMVPSF